MNRIRQILRLVAAMGAAWLALIAGLLLYGADMISLAAVVWLVLYLLVAGLIFYLLFWLINYVNPPEPFKKVAMVILVVLAVVVIISVLLSVIGAPPVIRVGP